MPIWAISPRAEHAGYTLLELLVVLLIFGLLSGLAVPRLLNAYASLQAAYQRDDVLARLGGLGYQAYLQGQGFELSVYPAQAGGEGLPLELPPGWQLRADAPIRFRGNGACEGGALALQYQGQTYRARLDPPYCQPRLL